MGWFIKALCSYIHTYIHTHIHNAMETVELVKTLLGGGRHTHTHTHTHMMRA